MTRIPDFRLAVMNKTTDEKNGSIGAAWVNKDRTISIVLTPFVQLPMQDGKGSILMTLFPSEKESST